MSEELTDCEKTFLAFLNTDNKKKKKIKKKVKEETKFSDSILMTMKMKSIKKHCLKEIYSIKQNYMANIRKGGGKAC